MYELLSRLDAHGWCARVRKRSQRVAPYVPGCEKVAWLNAKQKTWGRNYLLALLQADTRQMEVPHFKPDGWYTALLRDNKYLPRKRKAALLDEFHCAAIDVASGAPPAAPLRPTVPIL